uniref:Voltage-gated ion channel superfamily n=1 Tax=Tetraselmis sp. GSL018 TaxID=582737 RepID=A0A061SEQ6_9CHLO
MVRIVPSQFEADGDASDSEALSRNPNKHEADSATSMQEPSPPAESKPDNPPDQASREPRHARFEERDSVESDQFPVPDDETEARPMISLLRTDSSRLRGKSFLQQADKNRTIYEALAEHTEHMYSTPRGLLDPRKKGMQHWDLLIAVLLIFTAVVTPYEVAFLQMNSPLDALFIINRIVDFSFIVDMIIQFNLIYHDASTNAWVTDRRRIARRYLMGPFLIDFLSIIPFDTVGMVLEDGSIQKLKIFRIVRLLRLVKLLRIIRSGKIFKQMEHYLNMGYAMLTLIKFILGTLAIAHWMACAWMLCQQIENSCHNWIMYYFGTPEDIDRYCSDVPVEECLLRFPGDCQPDASCANGCGTWYHREEAGEFLGISTLHLFVTSYYWSLVTMSTIGYGDVLPNTPTERAFTIMAMIFGTSVFAYVVGSVCGIVANLDKKSTEFYELMDNLTNFAHENQLDAELLNKLRAYFRYRSQYTAMSEWNDLLRLMSPALRGEVAMLKSGNWVGKIPYFAKAPREFMIEIAMRLESETYPPWEEIMHMDQHSEKMFIIERGIVGCKGRVIVRGRAIGAELMLTNYPADYTARALTYTDLFCLHRDSLKEVSERYPPVQTALRKASCKEICRRQALGFMRMLDEISSGHVNRRHAFSKSSFQSLAIRNNPKEHTRHQRETYLREIAYEIFHKMQAPGNIMHFPTITSTKMAEMIMREEEQQTVDSEQNNAAFTEAIQSLSREQQSLKEELASLSRILRQIVARQSRFDEAPAILPSDSSENRRPRML